MDNDPLDVSLEMTDLSPLVNEVWFPYTSDESISNILGLRSSGPVTISGHWEAKPFSCELKEPSSFEWKMTWPRFPRRTKKAMGKWVTHGLTSLTNNEFLRVRRTFRRGEFVPITGH